VVGPPLGRKPEPFAWELLPIRDLGVTGPTRRGVTAPSAPPPPSPPKPPPIANFRPLPLLLLLLPPPFSRAPCAPRTPPPRELGASLCCESQSSTWRLSDRWFPLQLWSPSTTTKSLGCGRASTSAVAPSAPSRHITSPLATKNNLGLLLRHGPCAGTSMLFTPHGYEIRGEGNPSKPSKHTPVKKEVTCKNKRKKGEVKKRGRTNFQLLCLLVPYPDEPSHVLALVQGG
jgi:hypothetical protein